MKILVRILPVMLAPLWSIGFDAPAGAQDVKPLLKQIRAVGANGKGNVAAAKAWQKLTATGSQSLVDILIALDGANPVAANYLRSAFEAVADKTLSQGQALPADKLEAFILDTKQDQRARRLAYEWLTRIDKSAPDRLKPKMVNDPSAELRRDAVADLIADSKKLFDDGNKSKARKAYLRALQFARDRDQVEEIAAKLKKLNVKVDLTKHFGFITRWKVISPFNNKDGVGYAAIYPPDRKVDMSVVYKGKDGKAASWKDHVTKGKLGMVDFNEIYGDWHGVVAYGFTIVDSPKERPVEIRASSNNAVAIYLNGKKIYGREEYHHGVRMDMHIGKGTLKQGRNAILIKVCQNEQTETWAQQWSFNLRVTDHLGAKVPLRVVALRSEID